jgi:protein SCO1/2
MTAKVAACLVALLLAAAAATAAAEPVAGRADADPSRALLREIDFVQNLGARLPLDAHFVDAAGAPVRLGALLGARPAFVVLAYYRCPNLCGTMLRTVALSLAPLALTAGRDFDVIVVGIDPDEGPGAAAEAKAEMLRAYGPRADARGWHVLTGGEDEIAAVADAIGFRYAWDETAGQYIHPAGMTLVTPAGRVARYYYCLEYLGRDLRLGVVEASEGRIGSAVDRVLLLCYGYDPATGRYTLVVTNLLRIAGIGTVLALAVFVGLHLVRDRRRQSARGGSSCDVQMREG